MLFKLRKQIAFPVYQYNRHILRVIYGRHIMQLTKELLDKIYDENKEETDDQHPYVFNRLNEDPQDRLKTINQDGPLNMLFPHIL